MSQSSLSSSSNQAQATIRRTRSADDLLYAQRGRDPQGRSWSVLSFSSDDRYQAGALSALSTLKRSSSEGDLNHHKLYAAGSDLSSITRGSESSSPLLDKIEPKPMASPTLSEIGDRQLGVSDLDEESAAVVYSPRETKAWKVREFRKLVHEYLGIEIHLDRLSEQLESICQRFDLQIDESMLGSSFEDRDLVCMRKLTEIMHHHQRLMASTHVDIQTTIEVDQFVRATLRDRVLQQGPSKLIRKTWRYKAHLLEIMINPKTGLVAYKSGRDHIVGKGASKAAVAAYEYFSANFLTLLKPLSRLSPDAAFARAGHDEEDRSPSVRAGYSEVQQEGLQGAFDDFERDEQTEDGTSVKSLQGTVNLASAVHEAEEAVQISRAREAGPAQDSDRESFLNDLVFPDPQARRVSKELPMPAPARLQALESASLEEAKTSLDTWNDQQREIYFSRRLSGLEGIVTTLYADEELGELLQPRAMSLSQLMQEPSQRDRVNRSLIGAIRGLVSMHAQGVLHRDIKPGNILVDEKGGQLCDFGSCCLVEQDDAYLEKFLSTILYAAPEMAQACLDPTLSRQLVTPACDIWAMGLVLYEAQGKSLYEHPVLKRLENKIEPAKLFVLSNLCSPEGRLEYERLYPEPTDRSSIDHLIWRCLRLDPKERPTASELLMAYRRWLEHA